MDRSRVREVIERNKESFGRVLSIDYNRLPCSVFDLSCDSEDLKSVDMSNPEEFERYLISVMEKDGSKFGIGLYAEDRCIYDHSDLFDDSERRTLHLGIDLWCEAGVDVLCPLDGKVHSFANNCGDGDYGPTVILEHVLDGVVFYTLYGHLSESSLVNIGEGDVVLRGEKIGEVGDYPINGNWPPHLHFEIISDMMDRSGDFPGVAPKDREVEFLDSCPNPNLILNIDKLNDFYSD